MRSKVKVPDNGIFMAERFEPQSPAQIETEKKPHLMDVFPMGDGFLEHYRAIEGKEQKTIEIMQDVVYTFLDQELKNTRIFKSEALGAEFPFTVVSVKELAAEIFLHYENLSEVQILAEKKDEERDEGKRETQKMEFIMSSFSSLRGGSQFAYAEFAIHQAIKLLPRAIESLKNGKELEDYKIYTLGSPTNELGNMEENFSLQFKEKPFEAIGKLYAECVSSELSKLDEKEKNASITFKGVSMGASMAAETAALLIQENKVTQETGRGDLPKLALNMYVPAALNESFLRKLQVPLGFVAEGIYQFATEHGVRKVILGQGEFFDKMYRVLPENIRPRMDQSQIKRKTEGLGALKKAVMSGAPLPEKIKVSETVGVYDPLMFSMDRKRQYDRRVTERAGSLGANILPSKKGERIFGLKMTHRVPFFRNNEFKRWDKLAEIISSLKKQ